MALKKLPKWAIKQAGGINKKAWRLARRGRKTGRKRVAKRKVKRRRVRRSNPGPRKPMGIVGKMNAALRGLRLGLPAIGGIMNRGLNEGTPQDLLMRYSGFDLQAKAFNVSQVKNAVGFYAGNVAEAKAMSFLKIPQMAGKKKILSLAANFLPEISAVPHLVSGDMGEAVNQLGRASVGYQATDHESWLVNDTVRNEWLKNLGARVGLGLFSKFLGPMINKHLPKGVNI